MSNQPSAKGTPAESPDGDGHPDGSARMLSRRSILGGFGAIVTCALGTILAGIVLGWFSGGHPATQSPTASIVFDPWTLAGKIRSDLHVASHVRGYCYGGAELAPRSD